MTMLGMRHSEESKQKMRIARSRGGTCRHSEGYLLIRRPDHRFADVRGYVPEHRLVYERHHKCSLLANAIIHHINGIKTDNNIENLEATTRNNHPKIHQTGKRRPRDLVDRIHRAFLNTISERMSGVICAVCEIPYTEVGMRANWRRIADGYICKKCNKTIFESNLRQIGYYRYKPACIDTDA